MMPIPAVNGSDMSLQVERKPLQLFLHAGETEILTFVLPPMDDLDEVRVLGEQHAHLERLNANASLNFYQDFKLEKALLEQKYDDFKHSPTYLNRLAGFAAILGDRDAEARYLSLARERTSDALIAHRQGENLIVRNLDAEAEQVFAGLDLSADLYANIRIASLKVRRDDIQGARRSIDAALHIDPIDYSARIFDGAMCIIEGRIPEAIQSFRVALESRPNSASAYANMAIAYKLVGLIHKALAAVKRAVALDPINPYFVGLLSDVAHEIGEDADALASLRYYIQVDPSRPDMWSRVARACFRLKLFNDAEYALKREGAIKDSVAVWNNLGVCYHRRKEYRRALSAFKHAFLLNPGSRSHDVFLAARNATQTLSDMSLYEEAVEFSSQVINFDVDNYLIRSPGLSDIYSLQIHGYLKLGRYSAATAAGRDILRQDGVSSDLIVWVVASLVGQMSLRGDFNSDIDSLIASYWTDSVRAGVSERQWFRFINNVAFAFAEAGNIPMAEKAMRSISSRIGSDAYPTATQGLVHMRKGNVEKAAGLYEKAIILADSASDKARIRQKLNLELGRIYAETNAKKSKRLLEKVVGVKGGERQLEIAAEILLRKIRMS